MSLINKLFGGKSAPESTTATDSGRGCTTTEESAKIYVFATANASAENTERIFNTKEADSYYIDSEQAKVFAERIMEFDFDNPAGLTALLNELWKDDAEMRELIPVIKVAAFTNRDKYDSKYKDLSLYNYTL